MSSTNLSPNIRRRCPRACENCRRRKERCNGLQPCQRCRMRSVGHECVFAQTAQVTPNGRIRMDPQSPYLSAEARSIRRWPASRTTTETDCTPSDVIALDDSSASTVLQNIRAIVRASIGKCDFTEDILDPIRNPPGKTSSIHFSCDQPRTHPVIDPSEAFRLVECFLYSTAGVLNLFDAEELHAQLAVWMAKKRSESDLTSAIFYLVLAIGAQASPDSLDSVAEQYHEHGRYLGLHDTSREIGYASVQYSILVTAYLMGESLMEAAFIQLGSAVHAAFVLGLHRRTHPTKIASSEQKVRERLWKTVRTLDIFLSATLGRPIATAHHRGEAMVAHYSAAADICNVLEAVLTEIYAKNSFSNDAVQNVINQHREFVSRFKAGLKNDGLGCSIRNADLRPDLGVYHTKHGSYAIIQLLTIPFLIARISKSHLSTVALSTWTPEINNTTHRSLSPESMAYACVDSGISLVELFRELIHADQIPRRLPVVSYAMFYASISLGLAIFGDLDLIFPLQETMQRASELLVKIGKYDWLAERYAIVVGQLQAACKLYVQRRSETLSCKHRAHVRELFGSLDMCTSTADKDGTGVLAEDLSLPPARESDLTPAATLFDQSDFYIDRPSLLHASGGEIHRQPDSLAEELLHLPIDGDDFWAMQGWDSHLCD
ncbi:hypothetical protein GQ44DRAFT_685866 [Phaeosphaeriaceae sp. PMI808]|nr:hypothetical protein GQ44DRAFT_685866 [Phaeosphaeriaceae sp. PMI808]